MDGAFEPTETDTLDSLEYQERVSLVDTPQVLDLAEGEADATPILVTNAEVTPGLYNAMAWQVDTASPDSPLAGKTMVMQGTATKDDRVIDFDISLDRPIQYLCGEYVGDERKGMVEADSPGELETTFHFDHVFGDKLEFSAGYLAGEASDPNDGSGLFNGSYSALGQLTITPFDRLTVALTYVNAFNQSDTGVGSDLANIKSLTAAGEEFDPLDADVFENGVPTSSQLK